MKKLYFAGAMLIAATAAFMPATASGAAKATFNAQNVIVPASRWTPGEPYTALAYVINSGKRYEGAQGPENPEYNYIWGVPAADANGNEWYETAYQPVDGDDVAWTEMEAPFNTDKWIATDIMGDIYLRRTFTLTELPGGAVYLACGRDDAPSEWYINGVLVHAETDGWNEDAVVLLSDEAKATLKVGENLFAVHVHQNWGGAFADCGLYEADQQVDLLSTLTEGWWPAYYKTLTSNADIETAIADGCFASNADESSWTVSVGPFSNSNDKFRTTYWNSDRSPILVRRHFNLSEANATALKNNGEVYLTISYDEWPEVYLNGKLLWKFDDEERNAWNDDNYETILLNAEQKSYLVAGDNVLGVSLRQGGGGGHIDYGFYTLLPCQGFTADESADVNFLKALINRLIDEAGKLTQTTSAITAATAEAAQIVASSNNSQELRETFYNLYTAVGGVKNAANEIAAFNETLKLFYDAEAVEQFNSAVTSDDFVKALRTLRYARRVAVAEKHKDVFEGSEPAEGKFYLYNVGRGQFLSGGSDWGAHAALSFAGTELTFTYFDGDKESSTNEEGVTKYLIETGLYNGDDKHFLNYRGYMDASPVDGFGFIPVDGKPGVYNMIQFDYPEVHTAWNPYASVDAGNSDETTVGTECRNLDPTDPNAQWKLVTRAEREALLAKASLDNPVDATFYMQSPGFNQREEVSAWQLDGGFSIWGRGGNYYDFACESWNTDAGAELVQSIYGLPAGTYRVSVQGFYRNGSFGHDNIDGYECVGQANLPVLQNAVLYAGDDTADDVLLPSIVAESGMAPGEGDTVTSDDGSVTYSIPNGIVQATNYFKSGLYKVGTVIDFNGSVMPIGIYKDAMGDEPGDWIVVDNFRITYYGTETNKEEVKAGIKDVIADEVSRPTDNRIFNLHGIEVKNPTAPGIYIQNGKKYIVK